MRFSPVTIGVTALFILRLAAASFGHVDVGAALANPNQPRPTHSRFAPHHRHEGGENSFVSHYHKHRLTDDHYPSKEKRQWSGAGSRAAAAKKAQANALRSKLRQLEVPRPPPTTYHATDHRVKALFGRAIAKPHSAPPSKGIKVNFGNPGQLEQQNHGIGAHINEVWREQQSLQSALSGTSNAGSSHFSQRNAKIANLFKQLLDLYQQPLFSSSSYSATEGHAKALWGRSTKTPLPAGQTPQSNGILPLLTMGASVHAIASTTGLNHATISRLNHKHLPNNKQDQKHQLPRE